ncbi:MAG TPA: hypothetical protein VJ045_09195 [Hyphomicrobiaceae bacterium]|nr:hypothetical protein [Hyphomicrobiaceae bacterium]
MFAWLKRKKKLEAGEPASLPAGAAAPTAAASAPATGEQPAVHPLISAPNRPLTRNKPARRRRRVRAAGLRSRTADLAMDLNEPPPKVGIGAMEIGPRSRRNAKVTRVHPDGRQLVARIATTGQGFTYVLWPDGTYRLAGRRTGRTDAPRLVIGVE